MRGRLKDIIKNRQRGQIFLCIVCVYVNEDESVEEAKVMVNGLSVCTDHAAYVRGDALEKAIELVEKVKTIER